jgi:hypothetical protein
MDDEPTDPPALRRIYAVRIRRHGAWHLYDQVATRSDARRLAERLRDEGHAVRVEAESR